VTLPTWVDPLYDAAEMRAVDRWAVESGIPSLDLMELAGTGLARAAERLASGSALPIRIVVGKGNNGGDGFVAARLLREAGWPVEVLSPVDLGTTGGDARANLERLPGEPPASLSDGALEASACVVDCLLGTGFSGAVREPLSSAIAAINRCTAPVLSCDVPSGVDASSGRIEGPAVRAAATATFHGPKIGLAVSPGKNHAGEVSVLDIGVPRDAPQPALAGAISRRSLDGVPARAREGTKFASGQLAIAGGSRGMTGAVALTAMSAARAGAGYVQVAVPASLEPILEGKLLEPMTRGLPDAEGAFTVDGVDPFLDFSSRAAAVVLGPGLGRSGDAFAFATEVAWRIDVPLLIDADALNAHAGHAEQLARRSAATILTPHAGEAARLLGCDPEHVAANRIAAARELAALARAIVVLKGDDTIVCGPVGPLAISPGGSPALASAGTGDVLSGVIGAWLAKGVDPFEAAAAGVLGHVLAGREAAARRGADHVVASDVIDALPVVLAR